jgi:hypothetical protein
VPAFGIMLHLLGATALGFASLVWGALLLFGALDRTWPRASLALAGLLLAAAWTVWLFRVTMNRVFDDDHVRGPDDRGDTR